MLEEYLAMKRKQMQDAEQEVYWCLSLNKTPWNMVFNWKKVTFLLGTDWIKLIV